MSEMVERVVAVLRRELDYSGNHGESAWERAARDAIAAMREPTEAMVDAALHCCEDYEGWGFPQEWPTAIDEALK